MKRKILKNLAIYPFQFIFSITKLIDKEGEGAMGAASNAFEKVYYKYCNFKLRAKDINKCIPSKINTDSRVNEFAIIIQGPIDEKDNFTYNTIKVYKKNYPKALIIISTWDSANPKIVNKLKELGCIIILNKTFSPSGLGNVNYQICTSLAGIKKAKEMGAKYVLKTRSDFRINKSFALEYLKTLIELVPSKDTSKLKGRVISLAGASGQMFIPFWIQDFLYFGYTEDMEMLFDIPYDNRNIPSAISFITNKYKPCTGRNLEDENVAEIYITKHFVSKLTKIEPTVKCFWECITKYFLIVDYDDLNIYWNKYGRRSLSKENSEFIGSKTIEDPYRNLNLDTSLCIIQGHILYEEWMENVMDNFYLNNK